MTKNIKLSESLEDYLEVIFDLETSQKVARARDIAERMEVQRGSVTSALKNLEEKGLINYEPYSFVTLTQEGKTIAQEITYRHNALKTLFVKLLNVNEETAEWTACRMEHTIDIDILKRLVVLFDFIYNCPRAGADWIRSFEDVCSGRELDREKCKQCLETCRNEFFSR